MWPEEEMPASRAWAGECFPGPSWPSQGSWSPDVTETHGILGEHLSVTFTGRVGKKKTLEKTAQGLLFAGLAVCSKPRKQPQPRPCRGRCAGAGSSRGSELIFPVPLGDCFCFVRRRDSVFFLLIAKHTLCVFFYFHFSLQITPLSLGREWNPACLIQCGDMTKRPGKLAFCALGLGVGVRPESRTNRCISTETNRR